MALLHDIGDTLGAYNHPAFVNPALRRNVCDSLQL